ncbi:hypothetical protein MRX96_035128 [Rhipicephalus microplus]
MEGRERRKEHDEQPRTSQPAGQALSELRSQQQINTRTQLSFLLLLLFPHGPFHSSFVLSEHASCLSLSLALNDRKRSKSSGTLTEEEENERAPRPRMNEPGDAEERARRTTGRDVPEKPWE